MTRSLLSKLKGNADWIYRCLLILLVCGQYYFKTNFVSRAEWMSYEKESMEKYEIDKKVWWGRLTQINDTLNSFEIAVKLFEVNKAVISDHETRIRELENHHSHQ